MPDVAFPAAPGGRHPPPGFLGPPPAGLVLSKGKTAVGAEALNAGRKNRNGDRVRRHHERSAQRIHYAFRAVRAAVAVADVFENDENNALIGGGAGLRKSRNGKVPLNSRLLTPNSPCLFQDLPCVL